MLEVIGDSGPAVLLLPGGGEAVDGFYPGLVEGLIADPGCRVILYDRPDRKAGSTITAAHQRVATALDTPLLSWPGAEHQVHLSHQDEVLTASRAVIRTVAAA